MLSRICPSADMVAGPEGFGEKEFAHSRTDSPCGRKRHPLKLLFRWVAQAANRIARSAIASAAMLEPGARGINAREILETANPEKHCSRAAPRLSRKESFPILIQNRVNGRIRAREVRVILASTGQQLGVMKLSDALRKAQEMGLDLVEVAANANPPVCRIVDFGKFKYEAAKHEKEKKGSASKLKEIKFRVNIDEHDYVTKMRHAEDFLDKGNKVRVQLQFRGREMAHQDLGMKLMVRVKTDLLTMANVEMEPKLMGKSVTMTLAPLPSNKRKRHFQSDHDLPSLEDSDAAEEGDDEETAG